MEGAILPCIEHGGGIALQCYAADYKMINNKKVGMYKENLIYSKSSKKKQARYFVSIMLIIRKKQMKAMIVH